jgi:predicted PurR-regulated permease PerM
MTAQEPPKFSPPWGQNVKLLVGMAIIAIAFAMLIYFRSFLGSLLLVFIIVYLLYPVTGLLSRFSKLSWKFSANLIFLILLIVLAGLSTLTGVALVQQVQSLIKTVQGFQNEVPALIQQLSTQTFVFGPFQFNLGQYLDLSTISRELLNILQSLVGRAGTLVTTIASGAASTIGTTLLILLISYFILVDAGSLPMAVQRIQLPGYHADIQRMFKELGRVWNAFLRGQLIIVTLVVIVYSVLLTILGVRYTLGLALLAGFARFVPYVGPLVTNTVTFLVALLQADVPFGLEPLAYAILVIGLMFIIDQIFDNLISPRIMGESLGVHPAAVLVAAVIATSLIGIIGLLMAAPVLASLQLVSQYIFRKMFDINPWPEPLPIDQTIKIPTSRRIWRWLRLKAAEVQQKRKRG